LALKKKLWGKYNLINKIIGTYKAFHTGIKLAQMENKVIFELLLGD
jgi:hypothetical protein